MFHKVLLLFLFPVLGTSFNHKNEFWGDTSAFYHVYPQVFKDTNNDGIGDLKGMIEKLPYIKDLGVDAIYLNPFYKSPTKDYENDISDFRAVDQTLGSNEDFEKLVAESKNLGLKIVIRIALDSTSDQHPWFQNSTMNIDPYTDYYIWKNASSLNEDGTSIPPYSQVYLAQHGWNWNEKRRQYFHCNQGRNPTLNLTNEKVLKEIEEVLSFWLSKNIDGIAIHNKEISDNLKLFCRLFEDGETYFSSNKCEQSSQTKMFNIIRGWRDTFSKFSSKINDKRKLLLIESFDAMEKFERYHEVGADIIFVDPRNFLEGFIRNSIKFKDVINEYISLGTSKNQTLYWVIKEEEMKIRISAIGQEAANCLILILYFLPGGTSLMYGDELGMSYLNGALTDFRFKGLTPFQWNNRFQAGFTESNTTLFPIHPHFYRLNVEDEKKDPRSTLNFFKKLLQTRKLPQFKAGETQFISSPPGIFTFARFLPQFADEKFIVVANIGDDFECIQMQKYYPELPSTVYVHLATPSSEQHNGDELNVKNCIHLRPKAALLLTTTKSHASELA